MKDEDENKFDSIAKKLEAALEDKKEELANGELNEIEDTTGLENIKRLNTAIIEFYTTNCPYCKQMTPILEELAESFKSKVYFAKVNIENIPTVIEKFSILGVPELIVFKKGQEVGRAEGLQIYETLDEWIDSIHRGLRPMGMILGLSTKTR